MKVRSRGFAKVVVGLAAIALLAVALAACGGGGSSNSGSSSSGNGTITSTEKEYSIAFSSQTAKAGKITFDIKNTGTIQHDLAVDINGKTEAAPLVSPGKSETWSVTITKPGTYEFYCTVPGHKDQGMHTTLTVQ